METSLRHFSKAVIFAVSTIRPLVMAKIGSIRNSSPGVFNLLIACYIRYWYDVTTIHCSYSTGTKCVCVRRGTWYEVYVFPNPPRSSLGATCCWCCCRRLFQSLFPFWPKRVWFYVTLGVTVYDLVYERSNGLARAYWKLYTTHSGLRQVRIP